MTLRDLSVRRLGPGDAIAFADIRLKGLRLAPAAFGSSYEAEMDRPEAEVAATLERNYLAGAWHDGTLIGVAGFFVLSGTKVAHRGNIWGVYVRPAFRGTGVARLIVTDALAFARGQVSQVHLGVVTDNHAAVALYRSLGFTEYGTEPRALCVEGRYLDEYLMVLSFDG